MQDLIAIDSAPARLEANFEEVKAHLERELERYKVVVTADTVGDAKKLATELNQNAQEIDRRRKAEVAKVSEPIRQFDERMKELVTMCKDGRADIQAQVKRFEDETREQAAKILESTREDLWAEREVEPEFRRAEYEDLVKLTALTAKGNLAKSARESLETRVRDDRALQDKVKMRLLQLENASYRAGLHAPLTRSHVEHFLFADDAAYEERLEELLRVEVARQEEAERVSRQRWEKEQARAEETAAAEAPAAPEPETLQPPEPEEPPPDPGPGKVAWVVTARFDVSAPDHVQADAIENKLRGLLENAGITSLSAIEVRRA